MRCVDTNGSEQGQLPTGVNYQTYEAHCGSVGYRHLTSVHG